MLDKGTYIWAIKESQSFLEKFICCDHSSIAASSLLPHAFAQLIEHFPWSITISRVKKILHWPPPREPVHGKGKRKANWNDSNAYYYCSHCSACHIIMPLFFPFFLFALKAPIFLLIALASLRQSLANKAPWNWKVNWNWMKGGDSPSLFLQLVRQD